MVLPPNRKLSLFIFSGWGIDVTVFTCLEPALSQHYHVTMVNYTDYCQKPNEPLETVAHRVATVIPDQVVLLGWSLGGLFAATLAMLYPKKIVRLITLGSNPHFIKQAWWPGVDEADFFEFKVMLKRDMHHCLHRFVALICQTDTVDLHSFRHLKKYLLTSTDLVYLQSTLQWLAEDFRNTFKQVTCPQWHFFSKRDALVPVGVQDYMAQTVPEARIIVIERAHHAPFIAKPAELLSLLGCGSDVV